MSQSLGLITKSENQAILILNFIENNCPNISEIFELDSTEDDVEWKIGIKKKNVNIKNIIAIERIPFEEKGSIYIYSLLYFLAHKFNATKEINKKEYPILLLDEKYVILSKENPLRGKDTKYGFIKVDKRGIKTKERNYHYKRISNMIKEEDRIFEELKTF